MSKTLATEKTHLWSYIRKGREKVAWFILKNNNNNNNNNNKIKAELHFLSLCFAMIPILVHTFYFYHI